MAASERRMIQELTRHTKSSQESTSSQIAVIDQSYREPPERVDRLERTVYQQARRAKSSR
jgi:hypothetical protein